MSLDSDYFEYPERSYGMDHHYYQWSMLADRKPVKWPDNKPLALWVNVGIQYYPLDQQGNPFKVPGGMTMPYPDLRHYSLRDYGNRVGIFRVLKAFQKYNVKATYAVNARLAKKNPYIIKKFCDQNSEIMCHGWDMDSLHYGGMSTTEENQIISRALDTLEKITGNSIRGWLSPAKSESENTSELLVKNGVDYFCDWVNDDMPFAFNTPSGTLTAMPLSTELSDQTILVNNLHSEPSYLQQLKDAKDFLLKESETQGGRILALQIHPWLLGQPHRIKYLEEALEYITSDNKVWSASASEILQKWKSQQIEASQTKTD